MFMDIASGDPQQDWPAMSMRLDQQLVSTKLRATSTRLRTITTNHLALSVTAKGEFADVNGFQKCLSISHGRRFCTDT